MNVNFDPEWDGARSEGAPHSDRALPWQVFGRDVCPATLFLSLNTGYVAVSGLFGTTVITGMVEYVLGAVGVVAAVFMFAAWWRRSIRMMLWGLAGACYLWLTIAIAAYASTGNVFSVSGFGALCWAGTAGGLWLRDRRELPRDDPDRR